MSLYRHIAVVLLAGCFAACAPEQPSEPDDSATLVEIPHPNRDTMQDDVAELLDAAWDELQATISDSGATPGQHAEAYAAYGLASFGNGLLIPAEAAFTNAVQLAPDDSRWIYFLALLREFDGKLEPAAAGFEQVLELRPDDMPAMIHLGNVRFEQARLEDARAAYEMALAVDPKGAAAHYGLGRISSAAGDDAAAAMHFEQALAEQPYADRLNYLLGLTYRNLGDLEKAQAYLEKRGSAEPGFDDPLFDEISGGRARIGGLWTNMNAGSQAYIDGDYERAIDEFRAATANHPDDPRSWRSLGMALKVMGDYEGARSAYERALELDESSAVDYRDLGLVLIGLGEIESAEDQLLKAVELDPQLLPAHAALAKLMIGTGRLDEALRHYDAAIEIDPLSVDLAISRAEVLVAMNRSGEALEGLASASAANPLDTTISAAYGLMLADADRADEALTVLGKAFDTATTDVERGKAQYGIGRTHLASGDITAAFEAFEKALQLNPENNAARLELARVFARTQNYAAAIGTYDSLLERTPENEKARTEAATAAVLARRAPDARRILEEGTARDDASPQLLAMTARLMAIVRNPQVRDPQRALEYALRALEMSRTISNAETVALCLAAVGRFEEAVELQTQVLDEAQGRVDAETEARMTDNLSRYRARTPGRLPLESS